MRYINLHRFWWCVWIIILKWNYTNNDEIAFSYVFQNMFFGEVFQEVKYWYRHMNIQTLKVVVFWQITLFFIAWVLYVTGYSIGYYEFIVLLWIHSLNTSLPHHEKWSFFRRSRCSPLAHHLGQALHSALDIIFTASMWYSHWRTAMLLILE